jgi:hypothetical protein
MGLDCSDTGTAPGAASAGPAKSDFVRLMPDKVRALTTCCHSAVVDVVRHAALDEQSDLGLKPRTSAGEQRSWRRLARAGRVGQPLQPRKALRESVAHHDRRFWFAVLVVDSVLPAAHRHTVSTPFATALVCSGHATGSQLVTVCGFWKQSQASPAPLYVQPVPGQL